jgi:GNAT superfamily N-acetyltransferase
VVLRRASTADTLAAANLWLRSRHASIPAIPAPVHSDDDVREHFASVTVTKHETWLAEVGTKLVGLLVLDNEWIDQLYVDPDCTGCRIGSRLLELAKELRPRRLELWTFQSNTGARRFYERHGFVPTETTDGRNEEHAPDVHYRWLPQ